MVLMQHTYLWSKKKLMWKIHWSYLGGR